MRRLRTSFIFVTKVDGKGARDERAEIVAHRRFAPAGVCETREAAYTRIKSAKPALELAVGCAKKWTEETQGKAVVPWGRGRGWRAADERKLTMPLGILTRRA